MPLTSFPSLDSLFTVLRTGSGLATVLDDDGNRVVVPSNLGRQDYSPGTPTGRFNAIPNPRLTGINTSTNAPPTGWSASMTPSTGWVEGNDLTALSTEDGIEYLEYRVQAPAAQAGSYFLTMLTGADIVPAAQGSVWTVSAYRRRRDSGGVTAGTFFRVGVRELDVNGAVLSENFAEGGFAFTALANGRISYTHTATDPNTRFLQPFIGWVVPAGGAFLRPRVGGVQFEPGSVATSLLRPPVGIIRQEWEVTGAGPLGLLLEDTRANFAANATQEGALAGNPGTTPDNWFVTGSANGITRQIVRTGVESGIPFVDYRFSGTATVNTNFFVIPTPNSGASYPATPPGSPVSFGMFLRLVAGSLANLSVARLQVSHRGEDNSQILNTVLNLIGVVDYRPLRHQRYAIENSICHDPAVVMSPCYGLFQFPAGVATDFTIRIALPQIEKAARLTSPIFNAPGDTSIGVTRGRDIWTSLTPLTPSQTLYVQAMLPAAESKQRGLMQFSDGGFNRTSIIVEPDNTLVVWRTALGSGGRRIALGSVTPGVPFTVQVGADRGGLVVSFNGSAPSAFLVTQGAEPTQVRLGADAPIQGLLVGQMNGADFDGLNGYISAFYLARHRVGPSVVLEPRNLSALFSAIRAHTPSGAQATDVQDGVWRPRAAGTPRFNEARLLSEITRSNVIRNPRAEGGAAPALPTNWAVHIANGMTWELLSRWTEDGRQFARIRVSGTPTATFSSIRFETANAVAASSGQVWTGSCFVRQAGGTLDNISSAYVQIEEFTSGGTQVANSLTNFTPPASWGRFAHTRTLNNAGTAFVRFHFGLGFSAVGVAASIELDIAWPQLELGDYATTPILPVAGTPAVTTRNSDAFSASFLDLFPARAGVVLVSALFSRPTGSLRNVICLDDGTVNNRLMIRNFSGMGIHLQHVAGTGSPAPQLLSTSVGIPFRAGLRFDADGNYAGFAAGGTLIEASGAPVRTFTLARIASGANGDPLTGEVLWCETLDSLPSNAEFQALVNALPVV